MRSNDHKIQYLTEDPRNYESMVFTLLAWTRRYWGRATRLHYSLLAFSGLFVL